YGPPDIRAAARHDDTLALEVQLHAFGPRSGGGRDRRRLPRRGLATVKIHGLPGHEVGDSGGHVDGEGGRFLRLAAAARGTLREEAVGRLRLLPGPAREG